MLQLQCNREGVSPLALHVVRTRRNHCYFIPVPHELQGTRIYLLHGKALNKTKKMRGEHMATEFLSFMKYNLLFSRLTHLSQIKVVLCEVKRFQGQRDRVHDPGRPQNQQRHHAHPSLHPVSPSGSKWSTGCFIFIFIPSDNTTRNTKLEGRRSDCLFSPSSLFVFARVCAIHIIINESLDFSIWSLNKQPINTFQNVTADHF